MRFIDTNLFLRYFTKDDGKKAQKVLELLKRLEKEKESVITSSLVVFENIGWVFNQFIQIIESDILVFT